MATDMEVDDAAPAIIGRKRRAAEDRRMETELAREAELRMKALKDNTWAEMVACDDPRLKEILRRRCLNGMRTRAIHAQTARLIDDMDRRHREYLLTGDERVLSPPSP